MYNQGQKLTIIGDNQYDHRFKMGTIVTVVSDERAVEPRILVRGKLEFLREEIELWASPLDLEEYNV